ncbi:hypothetical protein J7J83_03445 [bacterium]|nr:hypothetical protein [bacterium]
MDQQNTVDSAPKFTFLSLITRTIAGLGGGIAGTIVLLIIYMLSSSILQQALVQSGEEADVTSLFTVVIMAMVFVSLLVSNIFSPLFISFTQGERYKKVTTSLFQIFVLNIVIFVLLVPIYLFSTNIGIGFVSFTAGLQMALSVLASALVFEIISNYRYALLGVYSVIFAVLLAIVFSSIIYQTTGSVLALLFLALPLLWGGIGFMFGLVGMIYAWVVSVWGVDYLATTQEYAKDYGVHETTDEVEVVAPEPKDTEGVDFLRKDDQ